MSDARDVWIQQLAIAQREEALRDKRDEALRRLRTPCHRCLDRGVWAPSEDRRYLIACDWCEPFDPQLQARLLAWSKRATGMDER